MQSTLRNLFLVMAALAIGIAAGKNSYSFDWALCFEYVVATFIVQGLLWQCWYLLKINARDKECIDWRRLAISWRIAVVLGIISLGCLQIYLEVVRDEIYTPLAGETEDQAWERASQWLERWEFIRGWPGELNRQFGWYLLMLLGLTPQMYSSHSARGLFSLFSNVVGIACGIAFVMLVVLDLGWIPSLVSVGARSQELSHGRFYFGQTVGFFRYPSDYDAQAQSIFWMSAFGLFLCAVDVRSLAQRVSRSRVVMLVLVLLHVAFLLTCTICAITQLQSLEVDLSAGFYEEYQSSDEFLPCLFIYVAILVILALSSALSRPQVSLSRDSTDRQSWGPDSRLPNEWRLTHLLVIATFFLDFIVKLVRKAIESWMLDFEWLMQRLYTTLRDQIDGLVEDKLWIQWALLTTCLVAVFRIRPNERVIGEGRLKERFIVFLINLLRLCCFPLLALCFALTVFTILSKVAPHSTPTPML